MITVRTYNESDYETIKQWYLDHKVIPPHEDMLCEFGTFILEIEGVPALSQTVLLPQCKGVAILEYLIKNPAFKNNLEEELFFLEDHVLKWVSDLGYRNVVTYGHIEKLKEKYVRYGFTRSLDNLSSFYRRLPCQQSSH